jgi:hypothetical protein
MDQATVLSKTAKGREEVETRKYKLDQRTRSVLITVNGKLTVAQLKAQLGMAELDALLEKLLREDFVQPAGDAAAAAGTSVEQVRGEVARLISAALGPDGDSIALKVESAKTVEELRAYLESRRAMFDGALGKEKAAAFWAKVAALLG